MSVKKFLTVFSFTILFAVLSVLSLVTYLFTLEPYDLFSGIFTGLTSIIFMVLTIKSNHYHHYFIAYNQKYYLNDVNIFEDSVIIKEKKMIRYKNYLKDKVAKRTYSIYYNKVLDLKFNVYELHDNFQLITIKDISLTHIGLYFDEKDMLLNTDVLIEKAGIKPLEGIEYIEKYTSNDKLSILVIYKDNEFYKVNEYTYSINYAINIKVVFRQMLPHWYQEHDQHFFIFDTIHEAKVFAVKRLNIINDYFTLNGEPLKYFILLRQKTGTAYHEFQTGDKEDVDWDKTSIYLHVDIMEASNLGAFFARVIPGYDYFGKTIVKELTWQNILEAVKDESEMIKAIINELSLWAEESIYHEGCFTILEKLSLLREQNYITEEEYEQKKKEQLERF